MRSFRGRWRIVESEMWRREDLDSVAPAHLTLGAGHRGELQFLAIDAEVDYRITRRDDLPALEFSFEGVEEFEPVSGRGWALLRGNELSGRLFFHLGDESAFVARRERHATRAPSNKRLQPTAAAQRRSPGSRRRG